MDVPHALAGRDHGPQGMHPRSVYRMLRRITIGLTIGAALSAGPAADAFAFSGGVSHVVTHPIAMSTSVSSDHASARPDADASQHLGIAHVSDETSAPHRVVLDR